MSLRYKRNWMVPALLLALMALVLWLSPEERTLGPRIRSVYIHVAFTWAGLLGILLTGLLSLIVWWRPAARRLQRLLPLLSLTASLCFAIGFALSILASQVNWGGVAWTEPRVLAATQILAIIVIVQVLATWLKDIRLRGALYMGLMAATIAIQTHVNNAIHPVNPIFSADSSAFAVSVLTLLLLVIVLAVWFMTICQRYTPRAA